MIKCLYPTRLLSLCLILGTVLHGSPAVAQIPTPAATASSTPWAPTADEVARFRSFLASPAYADLVAKTLARVPPAIFNHCPTAASASGQITLAKPFAFGSAESPTAGEWWGHYPVSGCGNDTILNIYVSVEADGQLKAINILPGSTKANNKLERDATTYAFVGAMTKVKDCKALQILNTRFESYGLRDPKTSDPGASSHFRPWWETWTVAACGHTLAVPMNFSPDATGTNVLQIANDVSEQ